MKSHFLIPVLALSLQVCEIESAKILALIPTPSISHQVPHRTLFQGLAKRGHHLTVMTTDPVHYTDPAYENLTEIDVSSTYEVFRKFNFVDVSQELSDPVWMMDTYNDLFMSYLVEQMSSPEMQKLLNDPTTKFDACIVEIFGPPLFAVKEKFNCSLILISSITGMFNNYEALGSPWNPIAYPSLFCEYFGELTFRQRVHVVYQTIIYYYIRYFRIYDKTDMFAKKYFNNSKHVYEYEDDADLMIFNAHQVLGDIRPTVPINIYTGSSHIMPPKPLPKEFLNILDNAKNGVIYFSLGSNVRSADLPMALRTEILEAFRELPYTVIWKFEDENLPNKPPNVYNFKWLPQNDLLAHPNVKLFITQGGQQSFDEAITYKVPLIGIPFIGDQKLNVQKMSKLNLGFELLVEQVNRVSLTNAINEVLTNPIYKESITKMSNWIADEPQKPVERAIWWTEYVLRHGNTKHLRAPKVPLYQYYFLDMIGVALIITFVTITVIKFVIKKLFSFISADSIDAKKKQ